MSSTTIAYTSAAISLISALVAIVGLVIQHKNAVDQRTWEADQARIQKKWTQEQQEAQNQWQAEQIRLQNDREETWRNAEADRLSQWRREDLDRQAEMQKPNLQLALVSDGMLDPVSGNWRAYYFVEITNIGMVLVHLRNWGNFLLPDGRQLAAPEKGFTSDFGTLSPFSDAIVPGQSVKTYVAETVLMDWLAKANLLGRVHIQAYVDDTLGNRHLSNSVGIDL